MRNTTKIFGYDFICDADYSELADEIIADVSSGKTGLVNMVTPNAHFINTYRNYPELNRFCQRSKYILPDGQPIVWLSRFTTHRIVRRLTGSDFFPVVFEKLFGKEHRVLFVVSDRGVSAKLAEKKPDAHFLVPPFFEVTDKAVVEQVGGEMADVIRKAGIQFVFVGISDPKQAAIVYSSIQSLQRSQYPGSCIFFGLGASYQFYLGMRKRAPEFFRKSGLEWFYRLASEPRRMFRRYVFGNVSFLAKSVRWLINRKGFEA